MEKIIYPKAMRLAIFAGKMVSPACAFLIAAVTFVICFGGIIIGKKVGTKLAGKAGILGGAILIFIGVLIFVRSFI